MKQSEINDAAGYPGCGAKTLGFDATEAVTYASNNATPSLIFELAANESDWLAWKKFGADVTLVVTYYSTPTVPRVWDTECHRSPGLLVNDRLLAGQVRYSLGGTYALAMQTDGNLVEYHAGTAFSLSGATAVWSSQTNNGATAGGYAQLQSDGNFVINKPNGAGPAWSTGAGSGNTLAIQEDGNLVIYGQNHVAGWSSHTNVAYSGIAFHCFSNVTVNHTFAMVSTDTDINQTSAITYSFDYQYAGTHPSPKTVTANSGAIAQYVFPDFRTNAQYEFRAQACVRDAPSVCSAWSPWSRTYLDTVAPALPTMTVNSPAAVSTDPDGFDGRVGADFDTVTITPPSSEYVAGYLYGVFDGAVTAGAASDPTFPTSGVGCSNTEAGFVQICGSGVNKPMTLNVAAIDQISHVTVLPFDMAGNLGIPQPNRSATVNLYAFADTSHVQAGHSWATVSGDQGATATTTCPHDSVPDTAANATSATASALSASGICWKPADPISPQSRFPANVLAASGGYGASAATLVNTAQTFSVGGWFQPKHDANTGASGYIDTAISGTGVNGSLFQLSNTAGKWKFCVADVDRSPFVGGCVGGSAVTAATSTHGGWVFVASTYDALNHQLRIWVSSDGSRPTADASDSSNPATFSGAAAHLAASTGSRNARVVQGATMLPNGTISNPWWGQMANVFVIQTAMSTPEFEQLGQNFGSPSAEPSQR